MSKVDVPKGSEERGDVESVSSFPQHGNCTEAQPTVDSGPACGTGFWTGDGGQDVKFNKVGE
jgi:hypothetical protein